MNKFAVLAVVVAVIAAAFAFYQFQQDEDQARLDAVRIADGEKSQDEVRRSGTAAPKTSDIEDGQGTESESKTGERIAASGPRVVGRIVDDNGDPIVGVNVTLSEIKSGGSFGLLSPPTPGKKESKAQHSCTTGEDGAFYFAGVEHHARLEVRAWPAEYRSVTKEFSFFSGDEHNVGELVAEEGAILSGQVLNAASIPVVGATVSISVPSTQSGGLILLGGGNSRNTRKVISDENGVFRAAGLRSGKAHITARAKGFPPKDGLRVDVSVKNPVEDFQIQLDNGREIYGTVVDVDGKPAPLVTVEFQPTRGFSPIWFGENRPRFVADDTGKFVLTGVPVEDVKLKVYGDGFMTQSGHVVPSDQNTTLVKLENAAMVFGYLKTKVGKKSIKDFEIEVTGSSRYRSFGRAAGKTVEAEVRSGAEAAKKLGLKPSDGFFAIVNIASKRARFKVEANGYEKLEFDEHNLEAGEHREVSAEVARDVPFSGFVVDANGDPIEGANITMSTPKASGDSSRNSLTSLGGSFDGEFTQSSGPGVRRANTKSSATGAFEFRGLIAGTYKMNVRHEAHLNVKGQEIILVADRPTENYEIKMSNGATLTGIVYDENNKPLPGASVTLSKKSEANPIGDDSEFMEFGETSTSVSNMVSTGGLNIVAEEGGVYTYKGVQPGEYTIKAKQPKKQGDGGNVMVFLAGGGTKESGGEPVILKADAVTELDLHIKKKARVFGKVLSGSQPVVGAKVTESSGKQEGWMFGGNSSDTDDSGYFEIANLEPGNHTLSLSINGSPFSVRKKIDLAEGQQLKLDFSVPTGAIMGRVVDGDGIPIEGAKVTAKRVVEEQSNEQQEADRAIGGISVLVDAVGSDSGGMVAFSSGIGTDASVNTDNDGYYTIPYLEGGTYNVRCRKSSYSPSEQKGLELEPESSLKNVDFALNAACKLTIRATAPKKNGRGFFSVKVEKLKSKTGPVTKSKYFRTGSSAKFTSLSPGTYRVTCSLGDNKKEEKITLLVGDDQTFTFDF